MKQQQSTRGWRSGFCNPGNPVESHRRCHSVAAGGLVCCCGCHRELPPADDALVEFLAARQWRRMTRSSTPYEALTDGDKRACRALVAPVLADVREWEADH